MKISFSLGKPYESDNPTHHEKYVIPFSIVGTGLMSTPEIIRILDRPAGMQIIEQKILKELSALLQIELFQIEISDKSVAQELSK